MKQKIKPNKKFGDNLKSLRNNAGLSQEKLCVELQRMGYDIDRSSYAKYELALMNIRIDILVALKNFYHCEYSDFFEGLD